MRRVVVVAAVALGLALPCCRSQSAGEKALSDTAHRLGRIHSGSLTMRVAATMADRPAEPVGFVLTGPFQLAKPGALPVARLNYTRLAGANQATVQVVANGQTAWVIANGATHVLPAAQLEQLRAPREGSSGAVNGLHLTAWLKHPAVAPAGNGLDRVTGDVDAGVALADVLTLSSRYGTSTTPLSTADVDVLRRSAGHARVELLTGHADRLLRRLSLEVDFGPSASGTLAQALGDRAGPHISIELAVDEPNQPVRVDAGYTLPPARTP